MKIFAERKLVERLWTITQIVSSEAHWLNSLETLAREHIENGSGLLRAVQECLYLDMIP